jgi:acetate kinase
LALDVYVAEIRRQMGGMLMALGGLDAIVFTGGIGENGAGIRKAVCEGLDDLGIRLSESSNEVRGSERRIDDSTGRVQIWILPTNEELVVARQTVAAIQR